MKTMPAGEFNARCLQVIEQVAKSRTPVMITKKGRPVAKLVSPDVPAIDVLGCMAGSARIVGDLEDPVVDAGAWSTAGHKIASRRVKRSGTRRA